MASLPFSPRCIGARYGWVCVGGDDHGHFATIRVQHNDPSSPLVSRNDSMELDADSGRGPAGRPPVMAKELGGSIVNSVTLHRPPSSTSDDDVLAVLTYESASARDTEREGGRRGRKMRKREKEKEKERGGEREKEKERQREREQGGDSFCKQRPLTFTLHF